MAATLTWARAARRAGLRTIGDLSKALGCRPIVALCLAREAAPVAEDWRRLEWTAARYGVSYVRLLNLRLRGDLGRAARR